MIQHNLLALIDQFGYFGIFAALVLGIIGLPVPDELLMTFAGYLISNGELHYFPAVIVSIAGSFIGMTISYFIGQKFGYPLLEKYGRKIFVTKEKLEGTRLWFKRFGKFAITIGYFIPGIRHLTAYSAGISKWSYSKFCVYAAPGAMLWAVTFITLGVFLGEHWRIVTETIHRYLLFMVLTAMGTGFAIWYARKAIFKRML